MKKFMSLFVMSCVLVVSSSACSFTPYPVGQDPNSPSRGSVTLPEPIRQQYSDCNDTAIECNCGNTYARPGQLAHTSMCKSGVMIFERCSGYCPGGGSAWGTQCTCQ